jgi:hypothetical protein
MLKLPLNNHHQPATTTIEVNLNRLSQLFNSLDPSPFHERDLYRDAEEYIIGSAEEIPRHRPLLLLIHLPQDQIPDSGASGLNVFPSNCDSLSGE